jgi:hypothetical protein
MNRLNRKTAHMANTQRMPVTVTMTTDIRMITSLVTHIITDMTTHTSMPSRKYTYMAPVVAMTIRTDRSSLISLLHRISKADSP